MNLSVIELGPRGRHYTTRDETWFCYAFGHTFSLNTFGVFVVKRCCKGDHGFTTVNRRTVCAKCLGPTVGGPVIALKNSPKGPALVQEFLEHHGMNVLDAQFHSYELWDDFVECWKERALSERY